MPGVSAIKDRILFYNKIKYLTNFSYPGSTSIL